MAVTTAPTMMGQVATMPATRPPTGQKLSSALGKDGLAQLAGAAFSGVTGTGGRAKPPTTPGGPVANDTPNYQPGTPPRPSLVPGASTQASPMTGAPPSITPAPSGDVHAYMDPYTDDVLKSAMDNLHRVTDQRRNQLGTEAFSSGAFGDARHGVEDANLTSDLARNAAEMTATIKSNAFDKGMGWMNTDIDRQLSASEFNANNDSQWFQNQLAAMGLGHQFDQDAFTNSQSYADGLLGLDQYDRGINQDKLNVQYQDWLTKQGYDKSQLTDFINMLNGTPGQVGSSTTSPNNNWASMLASSLANLDFGSGGNSTSHLFGNDTRG